jgi:trigger factor
VTLTIHREEDAQRQLKVTVEVAEERVQSQMRRTARQLAREVSIPGFRRGKVPYDVLVRRVGEPALRADAIEDMIEGVLAEALKEVDAVAYRQPSLDDIQMDPLVLNLTIPLEPKVDLGDYRAIRREVEPVDISDEAVQEALEHIRSHQQILAPVERPAAEGDVVTLTGEARLSDEEGEVIWKATDTEAVLESSRLFPDLPFVENVAGMTAGEAKTFSVTFPEDYGDDELASKEAVFEVKVSLVQERELPELTDELAQKEGDYESVADLRQAVEKELREKAQREADSKLLDDFVEEVMGQAELVYPPAALDSELDDMLDSFKEQVTRSGLEWDDYLKLQNESEAALKDGWRETADKRVRQGLILRQFVQEEKLQIGSDEIDRAVDERLNRFGDNQELRDSLRSIFSQGQGLAAVSNEILMDKVYARVNLIVTGNGPDLATLDELDESAAAADGDEEE